MKLDEECQEMLSGKQGRLVKGAMEFLVKLGKAYDARDMVDIVFGQVRVILDRWSEGTLPRNSPAYFLSEEAFQEAIALGVKIKASGISGHEAIDIEEYEALQIGKKDQLKYRRQTELETKLGLICIRSCDPYLNVGIDAPPLGAHMVSMESSAIPYYNSVMGARLNRDGIAAFLAVLTGKYPRFGFHLNENRKPTELVKVKAKLRNYTDYGILGLLAGEMIDHRVGAFSMEEDPGPYEQTQLCSGLTSGGPVTMYHILGITPEARSDSSLIPDQYNNNYEITDADLNRVSKEYSGKGDNIDFVALGCPSHDVFWLKRIAEMLKGRTVKHGTRLWVLATAFAREAARDRGFDKWITEAGGNIIYGTCPLKSAGIPGAAHAHKNPDYSIGNMATDSIRIARESGLSLRANKTLFGEPERCIDAAVSGIWR